MERKAGDQCPHGHFYYAQVESENPTHPVGALSIDCTTCKSNKLPRMTDDQLREFVLGLCDGKLFTSEHVKNERDIPMIFMPLALGAIGDWSKEELAEIGVVWEWLKEAGPLGVNGNPLFFSMRLMHKDDWERAVKAWEAETERRKHIAL